MYQFKRLGIVCIISNCPLSFCKYFVISNYLHVNTYSTLKKKQNACAKSSTCKTYIVKKILTFTSFYFESYLKIRTNCIL